MIGLVIIGEFFGFENPEGSEIINLDSPITKTLNFTGIVTKVFNFDAPITKVFEFDGEYQ